MNFIMPFCTNAFEDFPEFNIVENDLETRTTIQDEIVVFNVNYQLSITKGENSYTLNNFNVEIPNRLGIMYKAITEVMEDQMERTDAVCVNCLYDTGEKYDLNFHVLDTDENETLLFVTRDENSQLFDEDYVFYFVIKLDEELQ